MRRRALLGLAGPLGAGALLAGCTDDDGPAPRVPMAAGQRGGVYRALGRALASAMHPTLAATAVSTAGAVDNLTRLRAGPARMAFSTADVAAQARSGLGSFAHKHELRALAGVYADEVHLVVRADSSLRELGDLAGRPLSTGSVGSGTEVVAERILAVGGVAARGYHRRRLSLLDSVAALRSGAIDAFFFSGGLPTPAIGNMVAANDVPLLLLGLGAYVGTLQGQYGEVYGAGWIPNSAYGTPSISSVSIPNLVVVPASMPDDDAYRLTRLVFAAKPRLAAAHPAGRQLDRRAALETYPLRLHPGAERYYRGLKGP